MRSQPHHSSVLCLPDTGAPTALPASCSGGAEGIDVGRFASPCPPPPPSEGLRVGRSPNLSIPPAVGAVHFPHFGTQSPSPTAAVTSQGRGWGSPSPTQSREGRGRTQAGWELQLQTRCTIGGEQRAASSEQDFLPPRQPADRPKFSSAEHSEGKGSRKTRNARPPARLLCRDPLPQPLEGQYCAKDSCTAACSAGAGGESRSRSSLDLWGTSAHEEPLRQGSSQPSSWIHLRCLPRAFLQPQGTCAAKEAHEQEREPSIS